MSGIDEGRFENERKLVLMEPKVRETPAAENSELVNDWKTQ